ncbi:MAG TPA: dihydroxyacetone kinase subunit DhaK [Acidobacteriota bacterium]|nr:dihydroxyacetone kinase subunit DhaK [Acidobacteriota bacterium]
MKKILNAPTDYVTEMLEGLCAAHPEYYRQAGDDGRVIARPDAPLQGKVGIVSGGGSGHLPVFTGYVGKGLLTSCAIGEVFSSPNVDQMTEAIRCASGGAGVLLLYGNYGGDVMNFDMAAEFAEMEDIPTRTVLVADDVASAGPEEYEKRRGVAGLVYAYKTAGAKAEAGADLDSVADVARRTVEATRSMGVALTPCTVPAAGRSTFQIGEDEMEIGMGIHGEPGVRKGPLRTADQIAEEILDTLLTDMPLVAGDKVSLLCNSLGATPPEELYITYRYASKKLCNLGVEIVMPLVGRYATSMEMAGMSLTVCKLDEELAQLLKAPCDCAFWRV